MVFSKPVNGIFPLLILSLMQPDGFRPVFNTLFQKPSHIVDLCLMLCGKPPDQGWLAISSSHGFHTDHSETGPNSFWIGKDTIGINLSHSPGQILDVHELFIRECHSQLTQLFDLPHKPLTTL